MHQNKYCSYNSRQKTLHHTNVDGYACHPNSTSIDQSIIVLSRTRAEDEQPHTALHITNIVLAAS
jgi:hypothetical protein